MRILYPEKVCRAGFERKDCFFEPPEHIRVMKSIRAPIRVLRQVGIELGDDRICDKNSQNGEEKDDEAFGFEPHPDVVKPG